MQHVELTSEELEVMREVLRHCIGDMDMEVFRTDSHDYKAMLKHRREVLERVMEKLSKEPVAA
jgi:hypothetical protein